MPFDLSPTRPNPLGLSEEQFALWDDLLAWLDAGGDDHCRFDYQTWNAPCGTHACIGGWLDARVNGEADYFAWEDRLPGAIGLDYWVAGDLFHGGFGRGGSFFDRSQYPTAAEAARCVRTLLTEGIVDWPRAMGAA